MDDYLFFFYSQGESGGSSDSPERRGMRGICSTTASAVTVRAPSGLRDGTVVSVSRRHRRAGLLIHHAGVLDAGRVLVPPAAARSGRRRRVVASSIEELSSMVSYLGVARARAARALTIARRTTEDMITTRGWTWANLGGFVGRILARFHQRGSVFYSAQFNPHSNHSQACDHERTPQSLYFVLVLHSRSRTMRAQNVRRGLIPSFAGPRAGLWPSPTRRRKKYTQT